MFVGRIPLVGWPLFGLYPDRIFHGEAQHPTTPAIMAAMFGSTEPPLDAVSGRWLTFAAETRRAICPRRIREDVDRLPAPRNRPHAPEAMARTDDVLIAAVRDCGL